MRRCLPGHIRRTLDELPGTLDATYERTLLDIDEQNWEYAHRLFQCITVASRPLRVEELAEFLAFDFDEGANPRFEADWRPEDPEDAVLSICSSLITVLNEGNATVVQFSHFSVKEFLTSDRIARGPVSRYYIPTEPAHLTMTRACLTVLLSLDSIVNESTIESLPLTFYAARYWVDHAKSGIASLHARDDIQRVFDPTRPYFSAWTSLASYDVNQAYIPETLLIPSCPLHRAVRDDVDDVAEWLITSRSRDPNELDCLKTTPLFYASVRGNLKLAQLLIKHGADVNALCIPTFRPLHFASAYGHLEVLRLLIRNGADLNARAAGIWTAVFLVSERGHLEAVRVLLENGADPNAPARYPPLSEALRNNHLEVAQLLLTYGANIGVLDESGRALLAGMSSDRKTTRQLLECGAGQGKT